VGRAPAALPDDPTDVKAIVEVLLKAEQCAVNGYTHLCDITAGKDHRTYDLSLAILNEEIEHEAWFAEFLAGRGCVVGVLLLCRMLRTPRAQRNAETAHGRREKGWRDLAL